MWLRAREEREEKERVASNPKRKLTVFFAFVSFSQGDWLTNMGSTDVNAVTWAIFPGQEIVQSTIIDDVSFVSWKVRSSLLFPFSFLPSFPFSPKTRTHLSLLFLFVWV